MKKWKALVVVLAFVLVAGAGCAMAMMAPRTDSLKYPGKKVKETAFKQEAIEQEAELQKRVDAVNTDCTAFYAKRDLGLDDLQRQAERNQRVKQILFDAVAGGFALASENPTPAAWAGFGLQVASGLFGFRTRQKRKEEEEQAAIIVQAVEKKRDKDPAFAEELAGLIGDECKKTGTSQDQIKDFTDALKKKLLGSGRAAA